ncbi:hypothetical protein R1sor_005653 [Riccia sorocarpa]|uniref:Uncharacterized protein n=1 Tax=Riccia sorocarpa TaxID=122646 RepID=A0ABD3HN62_9MARC
MRPRSRNVLGGLILSRKRLPTNGAQSKVNYPQQTGRRDNMDWGRPPKPIIIPVGATLEDDDSDAVFTTVTSRTGKSGLNSKTADVNLDQDNMFQGLNEEGEHSGGIQDGEEDDDSHATRSQLGEHQEEKKE